MSVIKKLAGQTAIYGISSMVARFLNYLLTPLYTGNIPCNGSPVFSLEQYGIITEMYAYVAFLIILLTYGMETAFFRFSTLKEENEKSVFSTVLIALSSSSALFIIIAICFSQSVANWLQYPNHSEYIIWFAIIVALDALSSIPLARLRILGKARKFASINVINVIVNIGLNLFFIYYCKFNYDCGNSNWLIDHIYNPEIGVGYVFISNLVASLVKFVILLPEMKSENRFDFALFNRMMKYAYPMLFVGLAGMINEMLDRTLLKNLLSSEYLANGKAAFPQEALVMAQEQLGIYGANYKITMLITLFIQAFRFAAEPFFFAQEKEKNATSAYAKIMQYFVIVTLFIALTIYLYLGILKYFTPNNQFWIGLNIVPILLLANLFLGIYYNQSVWYKLTHKTTYGAFISIFGAIITITINYIFIPHYGYMASAWATLICYGSMMVLSYIIGQKHYPVPYNLKKIGLYFGMALFIYLIAIPFEPYGSHNLLTYLYHFILLITFLSVVYFFEKPTKVVPSGHRYKNQ